MSETDGQPAVLGSNLTLDERLTAVEARLRALTPNASPDHTANATNNALTLQPNGALDTPSITRRFQSLEGNFDLLYDDVDRLLDHRATVETILTRHGLNRRAQPQVNRTRPAPTQNGANGVTINGAVHAAAPPAQNQRGIRPYHSTVAVMDNLVARLNELTTRVNELTTRVNQFTQLEATIYQLSARTEQIVAFFDRKTAQIDALSARVDRLSTQVHQLSIRVDEISTQVNDNSARTAYILTKQDALTQQLADLTALFTAFHAEHEALASRVSTLEAHNSHNNNNNTDPQPPDVLPTSTHQAPSLNSQAPAFTPAAASPTPANQDLPARFINISPPGAAQPAHPTPQQTEEAAYGSLDLFEKTFAGPAQEQQEEKPVASAAAAAEQSGKEEKPEQGRVDLTDAFLKALGARFPAAKGR